MKPTKFLLMLWLTATASLLTSCGGNNQKSETAAGSTDSSSAKTTMTSTIVTSPQIMMVVRHKVGNFSKWKTAYDSHDSVRLSYGLHNYVIARGIQDSNMVMVAMKADDVARAKAFAKDASLKQAMTQGGVIGAPVIMLNEEVYQDTAILAPTTIRSLLWYKVKDWDAWRKAFESGRQIRSDNGLTDRVYGHDVDDNHKVTVVFALTDTAKAYAYNKSAELKQRRAQAGVIGEPENFRYTVVQRY